MGFEAFRVELRGGNATFREATEAVQGLPHARPDPDSIPMQGSEYQLIDDGRHVIEVEIMDAPVKLSCRFTLCHPPSVDAAFLRLVREWMVRLGMEAKICDDVPPEQARSFSIQEFPEFSDIAQHCIAARRAEWIAAFGDTPMAATTNEVYQRVILPRCQPGVEQAVKKSG
jgi:hypothetical protein